jgi:hypothetical protein
LSDNEVYRVSAPGIECSIERRSCPVFEASNVEWLAPSEDRQMWRLLLARLHPDAGGDHDLFAFACAIREELSAGIRTTPGVGPGDNVQGIDGPGAPFLKKWQEAMVHWSSANRDALKASWTG